MALVTWYSTGTVSVEGGSTTVTGANLFWGDEAIMPGDLFCDPAQPLVPPQRVREVTSDNVLELWAAWPGATIADAPYEIRYVGIIERSTAQTRRVLEQLGDVKAWADMFVEDDAARLALDTASNPLRSGVRVLVVDEGMIWQKASGAYGDWIGPAEFKGDKGDKGWAPQLAGEKAGARRVLKLIGYVGGEGAAPTANVGKYLKGDGTFTDVIAEAMDIRGPAGDINGVTPFWQSRITADATAEAARAGLGAVGLTVTSISTGSFDDLISTGWFTVVGTVAGSPTNTTVNLCVIGNTLAGGRVTQIAYDILTLRVFTRQQFNGNWTPWVEFWHSGNSALVTQTEAESGTETQAKSWSPLRISQAIAALAPEVPADVYRRSNILATVTQSGGEPTGGIIERGENANGAYTRWADGTQICYLVRNFPPSSVSFSGTAVMKYSSLYEWDFPASFSSPSVSVSGAVSGPRVGACLVGLGTSLSASQGQYFMGSTDPNTTESLAIRLVAIGRWF